MQNILYICTPSSIHDVKWMSYFSQQPSKYRVYALSEKHSKISDECKQQLVSLNIELLSPIESFSIWHPIKFFKSIKILNHYIEKYRIDLVHVLFATPYAFWCNYIKIPYGITTRGSDVLVVLPNLIKEKGFKKIYFKWLYNKFKRAFLMASFVTCTSKKQVLELSRMFQTSAIVVKTGVDVENIQKIAKQQKREAIILSPRFFKPIYNIELQIDALSKLPKEILSTYTFVFIKGKNFNETYAKTIQNKLFILKEKYSIRYKIYDYLSQEDMFVLYGKASLCIMTPISDGTPNSALETMAAHTPLIISDLAYDENLFKDTCVKVSLDDPITLTEAIQNSILNYSSSMLDKAEIAVMRYGNRKIEMHKLEDLYMKTQ